MKLFTEFLKDDKGATAIEYGLIAAATGLVLVGVMPTLSATISAVFNEINTGLEAARSAGDGAGNGGL